MVSQLLIMNLGIQNMRFILNVSLDMFLKRINLVIHQDQIRFD